MDAGSSRVLRGVAGEGRVEKGKVKPTKSLTNAQKKRLCELSTQNPDANHQQIVTMFHTESGRKVERSTVTRILQRADMWINAAMRDGARRRSATPRFPKVEEALFELIRNRSFEPSMRASLSDKELMRYAKQVADVMCNDCRRTLGSNSAQQVMLLRSFRASLSWLSSFKKRVGLLRPDAKQKRARATIPKVPAGLEAFDIWPTEFSENEAREVLSNFSALDDLYVLEASTLIYGATPEDVRIPPLKGPLSDICPQTLSGGSLARFLGVPEPDKNCDDPNASTSAASVWLPGTPSLAGPSTGTEASGVNGASGANGTSDSADNVVAPNGIGIPSIPGIPGISGVTGVPGTSGAPDVPGGLGAPSGPVSNVPWQLPAPSTLLGEIAPQTGSTPVEGAALPHVADENGANNSSHANSQRQDSVVALLCTNGTGASRPVPWLIGKEAIRTAGLLEGQVWPDLDVRYRHNLQGWLTGRIVREWIQAFDDSMDRSVILVTSLVNVCDVELLDLKNVTLVPLPAIGGAYGHVQGQHSPTVDFRAGPMQHGIEQVFRSKYRQQVVQRLINCMKRSNRTPIKPLSLRAAAAFIKSAWEAVPVTLIRRAWRDLSYLPTKLQKRYVSPRLQIRAVCSELADDLFNTVVCYRELASTYPHREELGMNSEGSEPWRSDISEYIWLREERSLLHPMAEVADYVKSVCIEEFASTNEDEQDALFDNSLNAAATCVPDLPSDAVVALATITTRAQALHAVTQLAAFIANDDELNKEQVLYHVSSLNIAVNKACEQERHQNMVVNWGTVTAPPDV